MARPVYVILPAGAEWIGVRGTTAQPTVPVRWYLRTHMPAAATQTAVLIDADPGIETDATIATIVETAAALGGMAIDGLTQEPLAPHVAVES